MKPAKLGIKRKTLKFSASNLKYRIIRGIQAVFHIKFARNRTLHYNACTSAAQHSGLPVVLIKISDPVPLAVGVDPGFKPPYILRIK